MFIEYLLESYNKKWFHATANDFDTFDVSKSDLGSHFGNLQQANYVLNNRLSSRNINSNGNYKLLTVNLSIYNPLRLKDVGCFHADCIADQLHKKKVIDKDLFKIFNADDAHNHRKEYNQIVRNKLLEKGYDGVVYRNNHEGAGDSIIAIHPSHIKIIKKETV